MELLQLAVLILPMFILIGLGMPIFFAMGIACLVFTLIFGLPVMTLAMSFVNGLDRYDLLALPFYFLAGELMNRGGITKRLVEFSLCLVGHIRGGLSHVGIVANMIMAGVSGSAIADASATGSVLIPAMKKSGYSGAYSGAVLAAAATIGPIIPPSIPLVLYGLMGNVSIGKLFLAGAIPGIMIGIYLLVTSYIISRYREYPARPKATLRQILHSSLDASLAILMPLIILVGITSGIVTPTEAGVVAVAYGIVITCFVYREIRIRELPRIFGDTMVKTGTILIIISAIGLFSYIMANMQLGQVLVSLFLSISDNKWVILAVLNVFLLLWGCVLEMMVAFLVIVPILIPMAQQLGIDPVHFGLIVVINLMIGMISPPVGVLLFLSASMAKVKTELVMKEILLFFPAMLAVLIICTFWPGLVLWLPNIFIR